MMTQGPARPSPWQQPAAPLLDMTPEGGFRAPAGRPAWGLRIGVAAAAVAVLGLALLAAAVAAWLVAMLLPVVVVAGLVAWVALRFQMWRARRGGALARR